MIYITGDTHGRFGRLIDFCGQHKTDKTDIMIILGDAGINYSGGVKDEVRKQLLQSLPLTVFCIHGNHEMRPYTLPSYITEMWHGGQVYFEEKYPDILFAKDGEIFDLGGKQCLIIGGAYSVSKFFILKRGHKWFEDEQPSPEIKSYVERKIQESDFKADIVLSHTCPYKYRPTEAFLPFIDQSSVDFSTEFWLDKIEDALEYRLWYCGHFHTEKEVDKMRFLFKNIQIFSG